MYKFRLEFINGEMTLRVFESKANLVRLESLEHHHSINPFSTEYWEPPPKLTKGTDVPGHAPVKGPSSSNSAATSTAPMAPPPPPADAFQALTQSGNKANSGSTRLPSHKEEQLKAFVVARLQISPNISLAALPELFVLEPGNSELKKTRIKQSLKELTVRINKKKWTLKSDA
jgi:chromatin assembly factor 1 subunit A